MKKLIQLLVFLLVLALSMGTAAMAATLEVDSLEDIYNAYRFTLDGIEYQMPAPVSQFIENGWTLDVRYDAKALDAMTYSSYGNSLTKGDASIDVELLNATDEALPLEECLVSQMTIWNTLPVDFILAPGIQNGSSLQDVLDACGMTLELVKSDSDDHFELKKGDYTVGTFAMNQIPFAQEITLYYEISGEALDVLTQVERHSELYKQYAGENYIQYGFDSPILEEGATPKVNHITVKLILPQAE